MSATAANPYLRTKILTARPEELRLMLYDGALKFCRQGKAAIEKKDFEASYGALMRAQKIVLELNSSLKHDADPELCGRLASLYTYIYRRLVDANMTREVEIVDEAIRLIDYERETWRMLMEKIGGGRNAPAPSAPSAPGAPGGPVSRFSQSA
ncbi:MAG: flagellar export chaperone FliS [Phycisphaeraceae bacterium]